MKTVLELRDNRLCPEFIPLISFLFLFFLFSFHSPTFARG